MSGRAHIDAGRCAYEVRNPRGACYLGDLIAAVKRVTEENRLGYLRKEQLVKRWEGQTTIVEITRKELPTSVTYEERMHVSGNPPGK